MCCSYRLHSKTRRTHPNTRQFPHAFPSYNFFNRPFASHKKITKLEHNTCSREKELSNKFNTALDHYTVELMDKRETIPLDLPGFRFHPTEEELLDFYLRKVVHGRKINFDIIGDLNIYLHDPCELPGLAKIGEREWYFFVPRDRRSGNGGRPNRTTKRGFWKCTGSDRPIRCAADPRRIIGIKKTLVFYQGRAPRGTKTDWVMNEYRPPEESTSPSAVQRKEDIVLCKIYRKAASLKELEQRASTMEEDTKMSHGSMSVMDNNTSTSDHVNYQGLSVPLDRDGCCKDTKEEHKEEVTSTMLRPFQLPELQVPKFNSEWMQDPFLTQLRSPWLDQWSPYANILNF